MGRDVIQEENFSLDATLWGRDEFQSL